MRLLTRSDFDGLVSAVLLVEKGLVDEFKFVHPKDVQDGVVEATSNDILANIPYIPGCGMWFDHHASEKGRVPADLEFEGVCRAAPSAAEVIWEHFGGVETFGEQLLPLMDAVNRSDAGNLNRMEILEPEGWILLSFIMDPRTGLGRFQDFSVSNYVLMEHMIEYCRSMSVDEILEIADVRERKERYLEQHDKHLAMLRENSRVEGACIITDLRGCDTIFAGNRFLIYALHPEQNIELRVLWGKEKKNVVLTCGHSILNRTSKIDVAKLMLQYGGGGHERVGTCQIATDVADNALIEILNIIKEKS